MKKKRILAKVIDVLLYVLMVTVIYSLALTTVDNVASEDIAGTLASIQSEYSEAVTQEDMELANEIVVENMDFLMKFALISFSISALILITIVITFGKIFQGSIGKKVMKLRVKSTVREKVRIIEYLAREPLIYVNFTSIFAFLFFMFVFPSRLVYIFGSFAFLWALLLFMVNRPFWEDVSKTVVVSVEVAN